MTQTGQIVGGIGSKRPEIYGKASNIREQLKLLKYFLLIHVLQ